jgi:two-component system, NarL family, nitrate/nitrite response regulator NarL
MFAHAFLAWCARVSESCSIEGRMRIREPSGRVNERGHRQRAISVLVMGGVVLHREGIARLLEERGRIRVIGTATGSSDGPRRIRELCPDVALIDLPTRDLCGLALVLREAEPRVRLVALVACRAEGEVVTRAGAGICGYGTHETSVDQLVRVIEHAAGDPTLGDTQAPPAGVAWSALTTRERAILVMAGEGLSNKEIARRLQIELPTVKSHMHNILEKLHVRSRTEAAALALWPRTPDLDPSTEEFNPSDDGAAIS